MVFGLVAAILLLGLAGAQPAQAATYTTVVKYGPYTLPAGTMTDPGMIHNRLALAVKRPCVDCYITSFKPDLVYADGTRADIDTGNERTRLDLAAGYGYRVRWYDSWNLLVDLMNHSEASKTVYLKVTYTYR